MSEGKRPGGEAIAILGGWEAAAEAGAATPALARGALEAVERFAALPLSGDDDRAAALHALETTGRKPYLAALADPSLLERWAEAAFALIRKTDFGLLDLFQARLAGHGDRVLFQDMSAPVPVQWTYEQIDRRARLVATAFYKLAADAIRGPRVAIFSENCVESAVADLACLFYDVLDTPVNVHFDAGTLIPIFDDLGIDIAVTDIRERAAVLERVRTRTARPFTIVVLDRAAASDGDSTVFLSEYCGRLAAAEVESVLAGRRRRPGNEVATVMFTSGSTGKAKGVSFSGYQLVAKRFARAAALPEVGEAEVFLSFLPLYHTFGRYLEMQGTIFWGGTYVFPGNPSADTLMTLLPRVNPTGFISVPVRWAQLHERCLELIDAAGPGADAEALMRSVVGRRLRWGLSAAGYLDPKVFHFFERNGVALASGFGMTEGTGGITMTPPGRYADNTQGLPLPGVRVRLGEKGELQASGHYIARYLEDAGPGDLIAYPESPEKDYWLATGDVFEKLENGYYRIVDRIKDIYKNNRGQTIAPLKVESKFAGVPGFLRTFLVGDGRPTNVLFIVPDRSDPVLGAGLTAKNEREYYRRIVTAANADLPPYERVVHFALLDRDFDPARGEVTAKGSFNRKTIEKNFSLLIESLYRASFVEMSSGGLKVRIPLWFYRDLGILEDDLSFREDGLHDLDRRLILPLRKGAVPGSVRVGDLEYPVTAGVVDLGLFARQPRLWAGNPTLVRFAPCKEGWDVPLEGVSDRATLPSASDRGPDPEWAAEPARLGDGRLRAVHRLVSRAFFAAGATAQAALEELEKIFDEPELRTSPVIRARLAALSGHPEELVRCAAYRILLHDEPNPEYSKALSAFVYSGLSFLNEDSIEIIASSSLGKGRFDAFRQRMLAYREQLDWPAGPVSRLQFERIFHLLTDFCRYHPEYYGSVRAELAAWALHRADPALAAKAGEFLEELAREPGLLPGADGPGPAEDVWAARLVFDEEMGAEEAAAVGRILRSPGFLKRSIELACGAEEFDLESVPAGGIWISKLGDVHGRRSYRLVVAARADGPYDLKLVLDDERSAAALAETVRWRLVISSFPYGQNVLSPLGWSLPAEAALTTGFPGGLDLWAKIGEIASLRRPGSPSQLPGVWRRLFVEGLSAFFRAWQYSSGRIVPGLVSPANVIVPELDYLEEPVLLSLSGWKPFESALSLVRPMVLNFYVKALAHYPWLRGQLDLEWIFDACAEALGRPGAAAFLTRLRDDLARDPLAGPDGISLGDRLAAYLEDFERTVFVPLPALKAMDRYKLWEMANDLAPAPEKEAALLDAVRLYRLGRYPEFVRFYLYRHTFFAGADEKVRSAFDRLLVRMSAEPDKPALQLLELSDLQAAIERDEDRLVFSRMVFPRLRGSRALDILKVGESGAKQVIVQSYLTGRNGESYTFGETLDPADIGRLYRLFFKENYPKRISEQDRYYVAKDAEERVVGGLCYRMLSKNVAFIDVLVVASALQGGGIGEAMLEDFCGRMAVAGVTLILTHSYLPGYFLRRGFKEDKRWGALVRTL